ncbi:MAG: type II toxin-antitoxin system mRNA interferase toxin, RelE/StbE family [Candidatus Brocadiaceae bacterium]|uniref:type II toxin-antitoxin system RelE/ParE family toxin n=1 Tax=Candidatus Wunengus sp. YC61 TaxID=3367698 RepID=UPI00272033A0|nr:type II toxin-antitoxin system mRNA interferase toxin, RelE/StbE family [Candidatus Brocadiaceae bacterium]
MRTLIWSNTFIRAFKKIIRKKPNWRQDIENTLRLLVNDPFAIQLETHKLKGKLSGSWACSLGYDLRIIFDFIKNEKQQADDIFLIGIGTHEEVY